MPIGTSMPPRWGRTVVGPRWGLRGGGCAVVGPGQRLLGGGVAGQLGDRADRREPARQRVLGARQDVVDLQRARVGEDLAGAAAWLRVPVLDRRRGGGVG